MYVSLQRSIAFAAVAALSFLVAACTPEPPTAEVTAPPPGTAQELVDAGYRRYGIEAGMVEYSLSGPQSGTETIYFDHWGFREAKFTNVTIALEGQERTVNQMTLVDGETVTTVDLDARTGTVQKSRGHLDMADQRGSKDVGASALAVLAELGAQNPGTEEVLGRTCDVWVVATMGSTTCVWNSLPLKTVVERGDIRVEGIAVELDEDVQPGDEMFVIPEDVQLTAVQE